MQKGVALVHAGYV